MFYVFLQVLTFVLLALIIATDQEVIVSSQKMTRISIDVVVMTVTTKLTTTSLLLSHV